MKKSKIAIIGTGNVGATTAYALMLKSVTSELMLVDKNQEKCDAEVRDLSDAIPFTETSRVYTADLKTAGQADIIVITAGTGKMKPGQTRLDLIDINRKIMKSIIDGMQPINKHSIILVVSNPVDILTHIVQQESGLAKEQVIGSGTLLDTQRLRGYLSEKLDISESSIHAYVLGEHGNSQFVAWSCANVSGVSIKQFKELSQKDLEQIAENSMKEAYKIIEGKGATFYGIAACVTKICENILFDQKKVLPVSCYQKKYGIYFSMPVVLGRNGVEKILDLKLNDGELKALEKSAGQLKEVLG